MNAGKYSALLTLLLALASTAAGQTSAPDFSKGQVTIPYAELKDLLQALEKSRSEKPGPKPPVPAALLSARYQLDFSGAAPQLTAEFLARGFEDGWHSLPVFGGTPQLEHTEADDAVQVVRESGGYALLFEGAGSYSAKLASTLPPDTEWTARRKIAFAPAPATLSELRVVGTPKGRRFTIADLAPSRMEEDGTLIFHLPEEHGEWEFRLDEISGEEETALPSQWALYLEVYAEFSDGKLRHRARVQAGAETGSGASMTLEFPAGASVLEVEGEDLALWKRLPRREHSRSVEIEWENRDVLNRSFLITWEMSQSTLADTWTFSLPRAVNPEPETETPPSRALVAVSPPEGLELTHPAFHRLAESRQLPEWLGALLKDGDPVIGDITGADPVELAATWLPRLETAQATISTAEFETRLVSDGSMLVDATYTVQHQDPIDWTLALPSTDQILVCEVNGKGVRPIRRADGAIEFRLPAPAGPVGEDPPGARVHLCYALAAEPFDPVSGRVSVELPQTDLFVHRLDWVLSIPSRYEFTAVEGNVEIADKTSEKPNPDGRNLIHLVKEMCRADRPAVEVFYQRRDIETGS